MSNYNYFKIITSFYILLAQNLISQIVLQGTVIDNGGEYLGNSSEPVVNALVTVTDQSDASRFFTAYTNVQGQYSIQIAETGVADNQYSKQAKFRLLQNYPNPFNPSTVIGYELSQPCRITINIYDILGRKIKTLLDDFQSSSGQVIWDATDDRHQGVPSGLYICSMKVGDNRLNKKMLLIDGQQVNASSLILNQAGSATVRSKVLNKQISDQYILQVIGDDIASYEQQDLLITENTVLNITVSRTVTDIDGNVYRTVKIGDQWWMAENLKVTHDRNGDAIPNVTNATEWSNLTRSAFCNYNNETDSEDTWGCLYNWYAVNSGNNIAPAGWHMPGDWEWKELEMILGMSQSEVDVEGWRGADIGGKLKETGTIHWTSTNEGATNESGFTALGSGMRMDNGSFAGILDKTIFWTTIEMNDGNDGMARHLDHQYSTIGRLHNGKKYGFSVRCIRDASGYNEPYMYPDIRDRSLVVQDISQSDIYEGIDTECKAEWCMLNQGQNQLKESIPDTLGDSETPLYFILAVHTCDNAILDDPSKFDTGIRNIRRIQNLLTEYGGMLSFQVSLKWAELTQEYNDETLIWLADQGSEIALHIHDDYLIPQYLGMEYKGSQAGLNLAQQQPIDVWIGAFQLIKNKVETASSVSPVLLFTGAPMCADRYYVAAKVGLKVKASYKNPETRTTDEKLAVLNPWRPAGSSDVTEIATYDRNGPVIFVPSGAYPIHCHDAEGIPTPFTYAGMDYITMLLRINLSCVSSDRINVFSTMFHPWDFEESDFPLWKTWLDSVIQPLLDSHRIQWSTFGKVAEMYETWEMSAVPK